MNLSRYDHLLEQRNQRQELPHPLLKLQEECLELALCISHYQQARDTDEHLAEEMADVLLTIRGAILKLNCCDGGVPLLKMVEGHLESKANRLFGRLMEPEASKHGA